LFSKDSRTNEAQISIIGTIDPEILGVAQPQLKHPQEIIVAENG
jgi:hypothetical protein